GSRTAAINAADSTVNPSRLNQRFDISIVSNFLRRFEALCQGTDAAIANGIRLSSRTRRAWLRSRRRSSLERLAFAHPLMVAACFAESCRSLSQQRSRRRYQSVEWQGRITPVDRGATSQLGSVTSAYSPVPKRHPMSSLKINGCGLHVALGSAPA